MDVRSPFFQNIACVLIGVMFLNPIVSVAAEVTVDAAAAGNTSVTQAGNGVPVVNIATPNGNGLSHNKFTDYNVGQQGLILNNATDKLQSTQLGGYVLGNPNLKGNAASLILNEVNGGSPSQLRGYTEVAGQQAHVVVANPNGITCDGCGFINTPRATLSTGRPVVEGGRLTGYDVDGGSIAVQGAGLNASNVSQFDLITRSAEINADIHAQQLNIIAGRNQVDAGTLQATQKAADGSAQPALAIDSSALGGMYAGAIRLVGTETGVGVRLAGDMAASAGDLTISSNGQLTVGKALVQGNANLQAQGIALTDDMHTNGSVRAEAVNEINNAKTLSARGNLRLAASAVDNSGAIEAGVDSEGGSHTDSELRIESDTLGNNGRITAQGRMQVEVRELHNDEGEIVSGQRAEINAAEVHNQHGKLIGQAELALNSQTLDNCAGTIASNQHLHISASDRLDNQNDGLILAKEEGLSVNARTLNNQGGVLQANQGNLQLTGEQANNQGGKLLAGQGNLTVAQSQALNNSDGLISALAGSVSLSTGQGNLSNNSGRIQGGQVSVVAGNTLDNDSGQVISTQGALSLSAADELRNTYGVLQAPGELSLNARRLDNGSGQIGASLISATLTDSLNNSEGLIEAANTLALSAGELGNRDGRLRALGESGASRLDFAHLENQSGLIEVGNARFSLNGEHISNQNGTVRHLGDEAFTFSWTAVGQAGGDFITNANLSYSASQWSNESNLQANSFDLNIGSFEQLTGRLVSVGDMRLSGGDINNDGLLASDGRLRLALTGLYQGFGDLQSLGDLHLEAGNFVLGEAAQARSAGNATVLVSGLFDNYGSLTSRGDLSVRAGTVQVQYGTLGSDRQLRIETGTLENNGLLFSGGDMALYLRELRNTYGSIYSLESLTLAADENLARAELLENLTGTIESAGDMRLNVRQLRNDRAFYLSEQRLQSGSISIKCYDCSGDHHNVDYIAREVSQTYVLQDSGAALIHSGRNLQIGAGTVDNLKSTLSATGNIGISADTFNNHGEAIDSIVRTQTFNTGRVTDGTDERFRDAHIYPYNSAPLPKTLPTALNRWNKVSDIETRTAVAPGAVAIIQAGGNVSIQATQSIDNDSVRSLQATQGGAGHSIDSAVSGQSQPLVVRLNSQAAPDSRQQAVDPLGLPGFSLPQGKGGLFRVVSEPGRRYLVETNPQFASLQSFLNSDYLLSRLGYQPDAMQKRLGDGLYEQRLIRDAISARTGQRFIAGLNSDEAMFRYLMDNAIASKSALSLSVGVALSAEQVAALTHDIVWMEEREVRGQKVLVPVLYLAQASGRLAPSGSLIQGQDVALISGNSLSNKGTLRASNNLTATANKIDNSGLIQAGERISLLATDSIRNARGGLIAGKDVTAIALTGDITNERTVSQQQRSGRGFSQLTSVVDKAAGIEASNDLTLSAGRDIQNIGGSLKAGGNASLTAGQDLVIASAEAENGQMRKDKRHFWSTSSVTQYGSEVQVGGDLEVQAGNDLAVVASTVKARGDIAFAAGNDVTIASAANEASSEYRYKSSRKKITQENSSVRQQASVIEAGGDLLVAANNDLTLRASQLRAADNVSLQAGGDLSSLAAANQDYSFYERSEKKKGSFGKSSRKSLQRESATVRQQGVEIEAGADLEMIASNNLVLSASQLKAEGEAYLYAGHDLALTSAQDSDSSYYAKSKSSSSGFSSSQKMRMDSSRSTTQVGSLVSADTVVIQAGQDLGVIGSNVASTQDTYLGAGRHALIDGALETSESSHAQSKKKSGLLSSGGIGFTLGSASTKATQTNHAEQTRASTVGSVLGDVQVQAGKELTIRGSDLVAGRDIQLSGQNVNILAAQNDNRSAQTYKTKTSGLTLALSGSVGSAIDSAYQTAQQARSEGDSRLSALQGIKAGLTGVQAWQAAQQGGGLKADNAGQFFGISASLGSQKSSSRQIQEQSVSQGSSLSSGNNLSIRAGGSEQGQDGDIRIQGSQLKAGNDLLLDARRDILLEAAANTQKLDGKNKSSGGAVGISLGVGPQGGGLSVFANANQGAGKEKGNGTVWSESSLDAGRQVTLVSGRDTALKGAQVSGERIVADVGRDLSLQSLQDSDDYSSRQKNVSAGASVAIIGAGGGASFSASQSKINSTYRSVQEQTGLYAGQGGFQVEVGQHTQLDGAVLASTAETERNRLSTGTLGWSDIRNKADYQSQQQSVSVSGANSGAGGFTGNMPSGMLVAYSHGDSASGTTRSAISDGVIDIRDTAKQQQAVASLSRDVEHANGSISPIFDKEKEQRRLQQVQLIAEIGNQSMDILRTQGELNADKAAREELARQGNGNPSAEQIKDSAAYKRIMAEYGTGSDLQRAAQAITAALQGLAGGDIGSALAGASAPYLAQVIKQQTEGNKAAQVMAHAVLGAVVANAQGNSAAAGAAGAATGEAMAMLISKALYGGVASDQLSEEQKQTVSALATLAAGMAGAAAGGDAAAALAGAQGGKNAVENNELGSRLYLEQQYERFAAANCAGVAKESCRVAFRQRVYEDGGGLTGLLATVGIVAVAPFAIELAAAASVGCELNPPVCANQVGIWLAEMAAGEALPAGLAAGAAGKLTVSQLAEAKALMEIEKQTGQKVSAGQLESIILRGGPKAAGSKVDDLLPNPNIRVLTESEARALSGDNKGLIYVAEGPRGKPAAQEFQAGTSGAFTDLATGKSGVPALRYNNPNDKGVNFVKFDGVERGADGSSVLLIDAKTKLAIWSPSTQKSVMDTLQRVKSAVDQNPGYKVVYEFPNVKVEAQAKAFIRANGFGEIVSTRTRTP